MNQYLYVCHFSNGLIKVGRSIDPVSRIAQHAERVSCMGVELIEHQTFLCAGHVIPAESELIKQCSFLASGKYLNEWFDGLDYLWVCQSASAISSIDFRLKASEGFDVDVLLDKQSILKLSNALSVPKNVITYWIRKGIPPQRCAEIEVVTGISKERLRPDFWKSAQPKAAA